MDRSIEPPANADASPPGESSDVRSDREALLLEQAEWEQVRTQVEAGLADLERRLLEQVERLRAPRDAEEFRVALQEQLALAVERTEAAEARHAEMQAERDELVASLAESGNGDTAPLLEERDTLRRQLEEALADLAAAANAPPNPGSADGGDDRLTEAESEITTLRAQLSAQGESSSSALAEARRQRDEAESRLEEASDRLLSIAGADGELARLRRERDSLNADLEAERKNQEQHAAEARKHQEEAESLRAERDALQDSVSQIESERDRLLGATQEHERELEELAAKLTEAERAAKALAAADQEREKLAEENRGLQAEVEGVRQEIESARAEANQHLEAERSRVAELREKLAGAEQASVEIEHLRDELEDAQQSLRKQRDRVARLESELSAWAANAEPSSSELEALRQERDELRTQLEAAATSTPNSEADAALQEKFDLALADLQSQRDHIAELEERLAAGGEPSAVDQDELQRLREERDELQHRLDETTVAPNLPEDVEDLRARFEMAVEEVRELKTANADLEQRLASSGGGGGDDWESQKQRLLASLENEGEPEDPQRAEERATIQGTIQITDQVVAEKDREIGKLQAWLTETGSEAPAIADEAAQALLDEDALIQQERERLAVLEGDLREKLRAAELELSVERAKISRAQAEIDSQQLELETLRAATSLASEAADETAPKRRWLDKLGLSGEGQ